MRTLLYFVLFLSVASAYPVRADGWQPRIGIGSEFPVAASGSVSLSSPIGLSAGTSLGFLPPSYADVINDIVVHSGGYDEETAQIIRESLQSSLVFSSFLGYETFYRLRLHTGYSLVTLGGATTTPEQNAQIAGVPVPFTIESRDVELAARLHMIGVGISWPFRILSSPLQLRVGAGGLFTLNAETTVKSSGDTDQDRQFEREAKDELDEIFRQYAHTPVFSLQLEYAF